MSNELITNSGVQDENNFGHLLWLTKYLKLDGKIDQLENHNSYKKRHGYYDTQVVTLLLNLMRVF
jgi:hypothetical protein